MCLVLSADGATPPDSDSVDLEVEDEDVEISQADGATPPDSDSVDLYSTIVTVYYIVLCFTADGATPPDSDSVDLYSTIVTVYYIVLCFTADGATPPDSDSVDLEVEDEDVEISQADVVTKCPITGNVFKGNRILSK